MSLSHRGKFNSCENVFIFLFPPKNSILATGQLEEMKINRLNPTIIVLQRLETDLLQMAEVIINSNKF
jgi:hypothetical protein